MSAVRKSCSKCSKEYSGFGDTCSDCRRSGLRSQGTAKACEKCGNFFSGFETVCEDCQRGSDFLANAKLYTNPACPFAHRAIFALALCKRECEFVFVPTANQTLVAERAGMEAVPLLEPFEGMSAQDFIALKDWYKQDINATGEVPTLATSRGDLIMESEIVAEFVDFTTSGGLMPQDPVVSSRVRMAMKRFTDVIGPAYALLMNQAPAKDADRAAALTAKLAAFERSLDREADFCFGSTVTMADVHCSPFLYRLSIANSHWRGYDMFSGLEGDRLRRLLARIAEEPEFQQLTPITEQQVIDTFAIYANAHTFAKSPTKERLFAGRGRSEFGM